jgi:hypothetical protein
MVSPPSVRLEDVRHQVTVQDLATTTVRPRRSTLIRRTTQGPIRDPVDYASLACGLAAGVAQAAVFHPYDRALYLSIRDHRPFLSSQNWRHPWSAFFQAVTHRALSGGLYFPMEHFFLRTVNADRESDPVRNFVAGTAAGAANAVVLNPLSAIKYKTWGKAAAENDDNNRNKKKRNMWTTARKMLHKADFSLRPFFNGLTPTLYRDVVFGGTYTWLRLQVQWWCDLEPHQQWRGNLLAAAAATVLSGPFNYARNVQYSTSSRERAETTWRVLRQLARDARDHPGNTMDMVRFLQSRLRIGWGTARVALGMTFGHAVYDWLHEHAKYLMHTT